MNLIQLAKEVWEVNKDGCRLYLGDLPAAIHVLEYNGVTEDTVMEMLRHFRRDNHNIANFGVQNLLVFTKRTGYTPPEAMEYPLGIKGVA